MTSRSQCLSLEKCRTISRTPLAAIDTSRSQSVQKKADSTPELEPLTNNSNTGWSLTILRRSRFRELTVRVRRREGLACSRLASTRVTNSSNSETRTEINNQSTNYTIDPLPNLLKCTHNTLQQTITQGRTKRY